ncbi:hypothetical protein EXM22_11770 [Oceanispirochaeta crateris]|uniref:Uncharacterized protein n=1 Tax=Oceanispirochaeta crateris TaxID=2518645 RepID=A0A5C1QN26_9SPIO|nr:hypothetical protein [Oceanispirochaeta crateris]QEN08629.1 hypothetical protein EXM22_11770 [Oceanispirochaeta crateris]
MDENRNKIETPAYFHMESFRREEVLAQIGSFTQVQYQLFHNICEFWNPVLDYNHFILKSSKSFLASNNQLELLMGKLKAAHMGLLQYGVNDGEMKASRIILCDKDAFPFFYYLTEDFFARHIFEHKHPFLTIKAFDDDGITLPVDMITPLETSMLSPGFASQNKDLKIIGINRKMKSPILLPSGMMKEFITALISHIRLEMASPNLMENLSRITSKKISDIQKDLSKREPDFWIMACQKLIEHKEDLKIRFKGLNPLIFTSCQLLQTYFQNTITEKKQELITESEKQKAREEMIKGIKMREASWTPVSVLDEQLKEKEEKWPGFREEFKQAALVRGESKEQPELVFINNMIIHKDFLFHYFTRQISTLRNHLLFLYQDQMSDLLKRNRTDKYTQFFSRSNFRSDIMSRIKDKDLQLWELLQKPTRVAEGAYHYLQEVKGITKSTRIKDVMGLYFHSDLKNFRQVDSMFQLKLLTMFEKAYKELGWWGRFILRLTGRYESYVTMFSETTAEANQLKSTHSLRHKKSLTKKPYGKEGNTPGKIQRLQNKSSSYSPRDKRKAWAEFDDALKRKK